MKINLALLAFALLFLSNVHAMNQIDEAISKTDLGWVKKILNQNKVNEEQKEAILKTANNMLKERIHDSQSLFRSPRDLLRLLFGLGVNGSSYAIILFGLFGEIGAIALEDMNQKQYAFIHKYTLITFGIGCATWLFGLYNAIKGWRMSNAYGRLNRARQIQQLIEKIELQEKSKSLQI